MNYFYIIFVMAVGGTASVSLTSAADSDGTNGATNPKGAFSKGAAFLEQIDDYFSIRKSFLSSDDEAQPANFSWTRSAGSRSYYSIDSAVQLKFSKIVPIPNLDIRPTFEAHVSSDTNNAQDSLSGRIPITYRQVLSPDSLVKEIFLTASPVYEFDRENHNETIGGDVFVTANVPKLAIGKFLPNIPTNLPSDYIVFHWRPYLGVEGVHVLKSEAGTELNEHKEFVRFASKIHGEIDWIYRQSAPGEHPVKYAKRLAFSTDYYFRQEMTAPHHTFNYVELSPTIYLDNNEHFSVGLTYKYGKTTPKFEKVDELSVWAGIKF